MTQNNISTYKRGRLLHTELEFDGHSNRSSGGHSDRRLDGIKSSLLEADASEEDEPEKAGTYLAGQRELGVPSAEAPGPENQLSRMGWVRRLETRAHSQAESVSETRRAVFHW